MSRKDVPDALVWEAAKTYQDAWRGPIREKLRSEAVPPVDELLMQWTGQPLKVVERAIERAVDHGVVDFGVSLRTCWPERKPEDA